MSTNENTQALFTMYDKAESDWWAEVPADAQAALIEWYNVRESDFDADDYYRLIALYKSGEFVFYTCAHCTDVDVAYANDVNWDDFQGVVEERGSGQLCAECLDTMYKLQELRG